MNDLERYAAFRGEHQKRDNDDWRDPEFLSYYRSIRSSFDKKILRKLGLNDDPIWNIDEFCTSLRNLTKKRSEKVAASPDFQLVLRKGDRCFVWGNLYGAFHSFVRDLRHLNSLGVISEDLVIAPGIRFVFLGDAVNRSPFSLEVLDVLRLLQEINGDKIIYLRGKQETDGYWENFDMRKQIRELTCGHGGKKQAEIISKEINRYFSTLSKTLIVSHINSKKEKILCSNSDVSKNLLDETVKSLILGEEHLGFIKNPQGLEFLGYDHSASKWSLLSSPTDIYNEFFNFYSDSFIELVIGPTIDKTILVFYSHDPRKEKVFKKEFYDLIFGSKFKTKKYGNEGKSVVQVGSTMSLSGITGPLGRETKVGVETAILNHNMNLESDVLVKFSVLDDEYIPRFALMNAEKLLQKYGIDSLVIPTGTPTLLFYLGMVLQGQLAVFFPFTGAPQFRQPEIKNIVHYRASYENEARSAIKFLIGTYGIKKFAFFYQDDSYGRPIVKAARDELRKNGINEWLDIPHSRTQKDFKGIAIDKITKYMPGAIGCFSSYFPTEEFISELGSEFFLDRLIFSTSFLSSEAFERFLKSRGIASLRMSVVPDPVKSQLEIVKEYRSEIKERGLALSANSLEGYIAGKLLVHAIKKIGAPYTKERLIQFFEGLNNYRFKGLNLRFNPQTRDLSQPVWLRTPDKKWILYRT